MRVMVVGLGYVGLTAAAAITHLGHRVLGVDVNHDKLERIKAGKPGIHEPELEQLLQHGLASGLLRLAHADEVENEACDIVIVAVGTPSAADGSADMAQITSALRWVVATAPGPTIIAMKSSVPPGTGVRLISELLDGTGHHYVANPEFLRQGSAIHDWLHPSRIVIGVQEPEAVQTIEAMYSGIEAPVLHTDVTTAEMIKYASNALLVTKISFINEIAMLCERIGGHIDDVVHGLALDPRIGPSYLGAGIGWGGSCFPKDVAALELLASANGHRFDLLRAVISVNDRQRLLPLEALRHVFVDLQDVPVTVLGLTFKPGTDDLRGSPAISLLSALVEEGVRVCAYDPIATDAARTLVPENVNLVDEPLRALTGAKAVILATEWPQLVNLPWEQVASLMEEPRFVFDGRNALDMKRLVGLGFRYRGVGRNLQHECGTGEAGIAGDSCQPGT